MRITIELELLPWEKAIIFRLGACAFAAAATGINTFCRQRWLTRVNEQSQLFFSGDRVCETLQKQDFNSNVKATHSRRRQR